MLLTDVIGHKIVSISFAHFSIGVLKNNYLVIEFLNFIINSNLLTATNVTHLYL